MQKFVLLASVFVTGCAWFQSEVSVNAKIDSCNLKDVICAYQGKSYDSPELGLTISPREVASDSIGTMDMKLPGHFLQKGVSVKVGVAWSFNANGRLYKLVIINIEMNTQFFDARGGRIEFKVKN